MNLTCGRNPWKQASTLDSTYRAFTRDPNFLKTILPLSDELNRILGMIFERNPEKRIKVDQLREEIERCSTFSAPPEPVQLLSPPSSPDLLPQPDFQVTSKAALTPMDVCMSGSEGSLSSSGSSDDSDYDSDSGSEITEPDSEPFEIIDHHPTQQQTTTKQQQRVAAPAPLSPPVYVLPSQEYSPNPWATSAPTKPVQWSQPWGYGCYESQYDQRYASPVYHVPQYQSFFNPHAYYCPTPWS